MAAGARLGVRGAPGVGLRGRERAWRGGLLARGDDHPGQAGAQYDSNLWSAHGAAVAYSNGDVSDTPEPGPRRRGKNGVVTGQTIPDDDGVTVPLALVCWIVVSLFAASGVSASAGQAAAAPALDFEFFKAQVQPVFLARRQGYTRCVVCHSDGAVAFVEPLSPGASAWTDEQSRKNFDRVSKLVAPGVPLKSRLLMHPLEPAAGGDEFHNGGRQFTSQDDPQFKTLVAWVRGQTGAGAAR